MTASDEEVSAPGWDAIDQACQAVYSDQSPLHYGTLLSWRLGGPDPLQGISAYLNPEPVRHWHFVTYGFSDLYDKETDDPDVSGYGFELTFRLRAGDETEPPAWALNVLQNLGRYVFKTGNTFEAGHWMTLNGPIAIGEDTRITYIGLVQDPDLAPMSTPNGGVTFLQVVGLTEDESLAGQRWRTRELLDLFLPRMPMWITDLRRGSLMEDPEMQAAVDAGSRRDGSSTGYLLAGRLDWREEKRLLQKPVIEVTLGASSVEQVCTMLPLRLPFGRDFAVYGDQKRLLMRPAEQDTAGHDDRGVLLDLTPATQLALVEALKPRRGRYQVPGLKTVRFVVEPSEIKDPDGNVIHTIG